MSINTTTSIRLAPELREKLEASTRKLHRGKNWIISQALREYLTKLQRDELAEEARRQSLLAKTSEEDSAWEDDADLGGWKA